MNYNEIVELLLEELKNKCLSESNKFGPTIWSHHMLPVVKYANQMAEVMNADKEIVEIAAILHDYESVKNYEFYEDHHIHGAAEAERLLSNYGYCSDKIEKIKDCIFEHRGSVDNTQLSVESICVASADAMSHITNIPSLLHLAYTNKGLEIDEGAMWVKKKIQRSWKKLCPEAKLIMNEHYKSAMNALSGNY